MTGSGITVLCGGLGGARLALALRQAGLDAVTTLVTNVGDDWWVGELKVCPDTDAVLYALAGIFDEERGWGIRGDSFPGPRPGEPSWFSLGLRDRAHHERRTRYLRAGLSLTQATALLAQDLGVRARVLPVTDGEMPTVVVTDHGPAGFQEWLVRDRAAPRVRDVAWPTAVRCPPAPGVLEAIAAADVVVLASSSPVASLDAVLAVPGVREAVAARRGVRPVVALSPVVAGRPPELERDRRRGRARAALLAARGVAHEPVAVARRYAGLVSHVVLDHSDARLAPEVAALGVAVSSAPLLDQDRAAREELTDVILRAAGRSPVPAPGS